MELSVNTPGGRAVRIKAAGLVAEILRVCGAAASSAGVHEGQFYPTNQVLDGTLGTSP